LACETDGRTAAYRGNQSSPCIPHAYVAHPTEASSSQRRADVSPLHILYLCADPGIPVLGFKGASTHVRSLVNALTEAGHTVTVVCTKRGEGNPLATELVEVAPDAEARQLGQLGDLAFARSGLSQKPGSELKRLLHNQLLSEAMISLC